MRSRDEILQAVQDAGLIAIVRLRSADHMQRTVEAIHSGGVRVIEVTLNTPGAVDAIGHAVAAMGDDCVVGAGTVLTADEAKAATDVGAGIVIAPNTDRDVMRAAHEGGAIAVPGAFSPTEILRAMAFGADLIKLFPAKTLGPEYVREVLAPLDRARLVPTGGITVENVPAYFEAGAAALAVGGGIVNNSLVESGDFTAITENARRFVEAMAQARAGTA